MSLNSVTEEQRRRRTSGLVGEMFEVKGCWIPAFSNIFPQDFGFSREIGCPSGTVPSVRNQRLSRISATESLVRHRLICCQRRWCPPGRDLTQNPIDPRAEVTTIGLPSFEFQRPNKGSGVRVSKRMEEGLARE